ncbi:UPF0747 protein SEVCU116_1100, partial [Striga asiatica]
ILNFFCGEQWPVFWVGSHEHGGDEASDACSGNHVKIIGNPSMGPVELLKLGFEKTKDYARDYASNSTALKSLSDRLRVNRNKIKGKDFVYVVCRTRRPMDDSIHISIRIGPWREVVKNAVRYILPRIGLERVQLGMTSTGLFKDIIEKSNNFEISKDRIEPKIRIAEVEILSIWMAWDGGRRKELELVRGRVPKGKRRLRELSPLKFTP